jgi:hypothetical protein
MIIFFSVGNRCQSRVTSACVTCGCDPASRSNTRFVVAIVVITFVVIFVLVGFGNGGFSGCVSSCASRLVAFAQYLTGVDEKVEWPQPKNM